MDDIAIIEKHEEALRAAMLANDVEALTELLDDALVFTGPDGQVLSKSEDLSMHRDRLLRLDQLDLREIQVHRIGAMILTTTKATLAGHFGSTPFRGVFAYTRLWRQSGEHWRVVAGHAAKIG
ncbi:nuclear transport factor 2 family protein [Ralstonia pseudosolanacearum]|uniref:nuclear transport factor 2 family protein n=1 Tax=Ralstonia solanacearum species complex bacterium KE056 TaxID=3119585 RepID=UPI002FC2D0D2